MRYTFFTIFCLAFAVNVTCRTKETQQTFLHISNEMGLSQSNVKAIVQDSYGFMWFGTKNGLNRFDGRTIKRKECRDEELHCDNQNVSALYEDHNHTLWIGTDQGVYQYNQRTEQMKRFSMCTADGKSITNWIACINEDSHGNIWILAPSEGIFRFHDNKLYNYCNKLPNGKSPTWLTVCENGDIWACSWYNGLYRYNHRLDTFVNIKHDSLGRSMTDLEINMICQLGTSLVMGIQTGGVFRYDTLTGVLTDISTPELRNNIIRNVSNHNGQLWIGGYDGAYVMDRNFHVIKHYRQNRWQPGSLSDNIIYCSYQDRDGGIWLGTMFGGVNYLPMRDLEFHSISPTSNSALQSERIREMVRTDDGTIWIGTETSGFFYMNEGTHEIHAHRSPNLNYNNVTLCIASRGKRTLLSYFKSGIEELSDGQSVRFHPMKELCVKGASVYAITFSRNGELWLGTDGGVYRGTLDNLRLIKDNVWCFDILEASDGSIWIATMGSGVFHYHPSKGTLRNYRNNTGSKGEISSNSVSSIAEDPQGNIWFSTDRGGLCRYNKGTDNFTRFSTHEGLPDNMVYKVLTDEEGHLWFGTNHGLVLLNPVNGHTRVFTISDGLPGNEFNYKSALIDAEGNFYFGTTQGITWFNPHVHHSTPNTSPLYFSRLSILNHEVSLSDPDCPLKQTLLETDEITLPYDRANISLEVSKLNYATPQDNSYEYRLEPINKEWVHNQGSQSIAYANLAPGTYTLHLRARSIVDDKANWVSRQLVIHILPPWWKSLWAYLAYLLVTIGAITLWFLWYRERKNRQLASQKHLFEVEKEKELFENKVTFFTSIAHEIRTPLTLITGPLDVINQMPIKDKELQRYLKPITNNVERLMTLATQLLDFQRLGNQEMHIELQPTDVSDLVSATIERFSSTFQLRGKTLNIKYIEPHLITMVDKEAITKILSNLLNNALKYSDHQTTISLHCDDTDLHLRVTSDGTRIPNQKGEEIFKPFVQLQDSSRNSGGIGIGLGMARSLARLHHGTLMLDTDHRLNSFLLTIPLSQELNATSPQVYSAHPNASIPQHTEEHRETRDTLLIVEDEKELLQFIHDQLADDYNVLTAYNGEEALNVIRQNNVDLVISDIMMPKMDGYTLCEHIKSDSERSQIPVVMLTAKGDVDSKIRGLRCGAESYIEKPFSILYLRTQVRSLIDNRRRERIAFSKRPIMPENSRNINREDEELADRIVKIVNANLADENFNVDTLGRELCMSRSSLLRKIKHLFNISPLNLIRLIRLKRAAELIQDGRYRLGEIGTMVGFSSPSYFSKLFTRQFGKSPKEFEKDVEQQRYKPSFMNEIKLSEMLQNAASNDDIDDE